MRKRGSHRRQKIYNMKGCSSFFRKKSSKKKQKKQKGGCGGTCPVANHSMIGGYLRKRTSKRKRSSSVHSHSRTPSSQTGGGVTLIPQDVTNLFRTMINSGGNVYNAATGYPPSVDPSPSADQFRSTFNKY